MGGLSNRITSTNFEFLKLDWDLQKEYYGRSKYIEDFFVSGDYTSVVEQADKFEEDMLKKNIISEKVMEYSTGNIKSDALNRLKKIHQIVKEEAIKYGKKINTSFVNPIEQKQYQTNERKIIYVQTADNSTNPLDFQPNSDYLRKEARDRIKNYMTTAGIPFIIEWAELAYRPADKLNPWFRDHEVHEVLRRSNYEKNTDIEGNEWWKISLDIAKDAIAAVKENREVIDGPIIDKSIINLRPEQKDAVAKTKKVFKSKDRMLWNAKMRFGKTLTTYQLIKEEKYKSVLILTHRPVVSDSWYEDFEKMQMRDEGYSYGSKKGESIESLTKNFKKCIFIF